MQMQIYNAKEDMTTRSQGNSITDPPPHPCHLSQMTESPSPAAPYPDDLLAFSPVPSTYNRRDGWTPERQRRFIKALEAMGSVTHTARAKAGCLRLGREDHRISANSWHHPLTAIPNRSI